MLTYQLEKRGAKSKTVYLYEQIKQDILNGVIPAGERLPGKRSLAAHLGVSVITAETAYDMLAEEGYITARPRSGFYVNNLPLPPAKAGSTAAPSLLPPDDHEISGDVAFFPAMARIIRRLLAEESEILQIKPPHLGCAVLRNAIAAYLLRYRGMRVDPAHIIIGSGAEYLYGLIVQLLGRDAVYGIETPSYEKIALAYRAGGAVVEELPLGPDGIRSDALAAAKAGVLHVTPLHSFPSGVTASAEKRYSYLKWANERDAWIIEDDFDSEFASPRRPIETLYAMDHNGRVVYMNTFSKSISPAIRIGYMILPDRLMARYLETLNFYSCTVPVLDQYALAAFIDEGAFERHLGRMRRKAYSAPTR